MEYILYEETITI